MPKQSRRGDGIATHVSGTRNDVTPSVVARSEILRRRLRMTNGEQLRTTALLSLPRAYRRSNLGRGVQRGSATLEPRATETRHDLEKSDYIRTWDHHDGDCRASPSPCSGLWLTAMTSMV